MDQTDAGVRVEVDGAVATVVLDRPDKRNAQTPAMWEALADIGDRLDP
jgi:enoyl-CoA hydratase/carnithine racemase